MGAVYETSATASGGRDGRVKSSTTDLDLWLARPAALGGDPEHSGSNPEDLFAAGFAACFHGSLLHVARTRRLRLTEVAVKATVGLEQTGQGFRLAIEIEAALPGVDAGTADELLKGAVAACPFSKALTGDATVDYRATSPEPAAVAPTTEGTGGRA